MNKEVKPFFQTVLGKIVIGLIMALLSTGVKFAYDTAKEQKEFREAWELDEATEEAQMFEDANEKAKVMHHLEVAPSEGEFTRMQMNQERIIETLENMQKIDTLNADQMYQIKEELKTLKQ